MPNATCEEVYQGNSFPHLHGMRCTLAQEHDGKHKGPPPHVLSWFSKTKKEIKREMEHDWYRPPESCFYLGLKSVEDQHFIALEEDKRRDEWKRKIAQEKLLQSGNGTGS